MSEIYDIEEPSIEMQCNINDDLLEMSIRNADDSVKIIQYYDNIEGWKCQYAILPHFFRFFGDNGKYTDVHRNGEEYAPIEIMKSLSFPTVQEVKFPHQENISEAHFLECISWEDYKKRYLSSPDNSHG